MLPYLGVVGTELPWTLSGLCFRLTLCWASRSWRLFRAASSLARTFLLLLLARLDLSSSTTRLCCSIISCSVCILSLSSLRSASLLAGLGPVISPDSDYGVNAIMITAGINVV